MFTGFTPETVDFLWGIRMNNNREWFLAHKQQYIDTLYEPMKALGKDLFRPFLDKPGNILKVSRIYRDARLHHPDPYKESLWICIRQDVDEFLKLIDDTQKATGIDVTADLYKRPKPTDNPLLEPYFAWKGNISCTREEAPGEELFGPQLGQRALELFENLIPLYDYFNRFKV